jgi:hypothetical protein
MLLCHMRAQLAELIVLNDYLHTQLTDEQAMSNASLQGLVEVSSTR